MTEQEKQEIVKLVMEELKKPVQIPCQLVNDADMPFYAHPGDAGMDLRANVDIVIAPGETKIITTGLKTAIPEGYMFEIRPRSGLNAKTPLRVFFSPIDEGYRGEYGVIMTNYSPESSKDVVCTIEDKHKFGTYHIKKGDRVAQMILSRYVTAEFVPVEDIDVYEGNRGGGFGSSGVK